MDPLIEKLAATLLDCNDAQRQLLTDVLERFDAHIHNEEYRLPLNALIGSTGETTDHTGIVRVQNTPAIQNSIQSPHGGIIATIIDGAMGRIATAQAQQQQKLVVTSTMQIHYLATTQAAELIATGTIIKAGRTSIVTECRVVDSDGRDIAFATGTFHIITPRIPLP
ncbi:PaaI family thioesterase [Caryophanon tenue]|uniref:Thioesterase domain-containing protein n=1 Tax=Caryophanon tenue TaxID=33978 RepID=A0A1C0YK58_9BACL|nr:PaaI family thioesterase [Caryophanon tenue]OCS87567.1 hypothetical protein A6M13_09685 [Caryophanon tenue]